MKDTTSDKLTESRMSQRLPMNPLTPPRPAPLPRRERRGRSIRADWQQVHWLRAPILLWGAILLTLSPTMNCLILSLALE